jgi:hypothetical protein
MTDRKRLIELIKESRCVDTWDYYTDDFKEPNPIETLADYLLKNGVIVPSCAVGDAIFRIGNKEVYDWWEIERIEIYGDEVLFIDDSGNEFTANDIGKTVFLTKEEAEQALLRKEDEKNERM